MLLNLQEGRLINNLGHIEWQYQDDVIIRQVTQKPCILILISHWNININGTLPMLFWNVTQPLTLG